MKANRRKKLKAKHIYSIMCETLLIGRDNRLSLINVIGSIGLGSIPGTIPSLGIVSSFLASTGDAFSISVEDPKRKPLFKSGDMFVEEHHMHEVMPVAVKSTQTAVLASPVVFRSEGVHHIVLRVFGRVIHREPFWVYFDPTRATGGT